MENADIILRKLHNNEIDDVPIEEGNIIFDKDTKQMLVDDEDNGVGKRLKYGGSEKLIDVILTANTTTKTVYDDTITTDSIIRIYVDEEDSSFTYNSLSTSNGSVTITFNAMTQDVPIKVGIGAVSEFHQLITEGQASDISYNNSHSGMTATDVQEAIDELKSDLGNIELTADNVEYDNTTSGLQATNVQDAVDEITDNLTASNDTPFRFDIQGGVYGYLKADDSFAPFSSSFKRIEQGHGNNIHSGTDSVVYTANAKKGDFIILNVVALKYASTLSIPNISGVTEIDSATGYQPSQYNSGAQYLTKVYKATQDNPSITIKIVLTDSGLCSFSYDAIIIGS